MTPVTTFSGQTVAVFGLGGSGLVTALALQAGGATVEACDDSQARVDVAQAKGISTVDLKTADWSRYAALILSPGVPLTHPTPHWTVDLAQRAGVPILGDIDLFCRERAHRVPNAPFVAITGTNGKSTTTALIAHILRAVGRDAQMGGNIGTAILALEPPAENRVHVIECSSFQIDLAPSLQPSVGVLLNLSPDHLDRHGTMADYAAIKARLVARADYAVLGDDDADTRAITTGLKNIERCLISSDHALRDGLFARGFLVISAKDGNETTVADLSGIRSLRGAHNAQNACAAIAAVRVLGITDDEIRKALRTFPGLPHRMEEVGRLDRVLFINDSKATNADSTEKALLSFDGIYWILGGKAKEGGITSLKPYFGKIAKAYLIGEAAESFAATLEGHVPFKSCGVLSAALTAAAQDAAQSSANEPVVLLSPACASYDQYANFEVRGDEFRTLVRALPGLSVAAV